MTNKERKIQNMIKYRAKALNYFLGENNWKQINPEDATIAVVTFKHVIDADNIYLVTNNITPLYTRGYFNSMVLVVGSNKAVYLQNWQLRQVEVKGCGHTYLVKLNRKYFKPYTFGADFEEFALMEDYTFDQLVEVAKSQEETPVIW